MPLGNRLAWWQRTNSGRGTDTIQALLNALQMVGTEIYCSEEHRSGKLSWDDNWSGYGFPVPGNIRDLLAGNDKKTRASWRHLSATARRCEAHPVSALRPAIAPPLPRASACEMTRKFAL
jgi:hypothetical protein